MRPPAKRNVSVSARPLLAAAVVGALLHVAPLHAADAPARVDLVVPFPPGGGADFAARQLARALPKAGGPAIELVHRAGEDGVAGADYVARAEPDGRTLLLGSRASLVFGPIAHGRPPYSAVADFEPVALLATIPRLIVVHPSTAATTVDALVRALRQDPASTPCGTTDGLSEHAARWFGRLAGVEVSCVAYDGVTAAYRQDLLTGRIRLAFESAVIEDVQAGKLRALAVAGSSRLRALPNVPTASEAGLPGYDVSVWIGVFAPPRTPPEAFAPLADAIAKAMDDAEVQSAFQARGYVVRALTGRALRQFLETDQRDTTRLPPTGSGGRRSTPRDPG